MLNPKIGWFESMFLRDLLFEVNFQVNQPFVLRGVAVRFAKQTCKACENSRKHGVDERWMVHVYHHP